VAGDFRLDIESDVQRELVEKYESRLAAQVAAAQQDAWTRMYDALTRLKDRLTLTEDGKRKVFHDTTVTNAQDLCDLLTQLNVTNDPTMLVRAVPDASVTVVAPDGLLKRYQSVGASAVTEAP
jgi:hypothetical protein